jgi:hypothetical protein
MLNILFQSSSTSLLDDGVEKTIAQCCLASSRANQKHGAFGRGTAEVGRPGHGVFRLNVLEWLL